ncbi:unnamed protein product [Mesocestoides corti]|uniref:Uncharacterized protein n=1 Tax=Mesocestoides corti TaxID=53468 RepID=A0A3P6I0H1_MESCO|nr:unnamed protein product [Mesocestoides corti]
MTNPRVVDNNDEEIQSGTDGASNDAYDGGYDSDGYEDRSSAQVNTWIGLIALLQERDLLPAIAFVLSRAQIMRLVQQFGCVDLLNEVEKKEVNSVLHKCLSTRLEASDKQLSQVIMLRDLVLRGIAFHHSGMMPLLKEVSNRTPILVSLLTCPVYAFCCLLHQLTRPKVPILTLHQ